MCGIHLTIATVPSSGQVPLAPLSSSSWSHGATTNDISSACVLQSNNCYPEWLPRRGPDGIGRVTWEELYPQYSSNNSNTTTTTSGSREKANTAAPMNHRTIIRVTLQASVLAMRDPYVAQPVPIVTAMASDGNKDMDGNDDDDDDNIVAHLAWNGEVYQMLVPLSDKGSTPCCSDTATVASSKPTHQSELSDSVDNDSTKHWMLKDVFDSNVADTTVVAECMQAALELSTAVRTNSHSSCMCNNSNAKDRMQDTAQHLASCVLNRLVNAEYAFCLLTKDAVYYGRDPLGRRSLLVTESSSASLSNMLQRPDNKAMAQSLSDSWQLSSVATIFLGSSTLPGQTTAAATMTWTEVEPGMVHAYHWQSRCHVQVPIRVLPLPKPPPLALVDFIPNGDQELGMLAAAKTLRIVLQEAVRRRCQTTTTHDSSVAVLFSGGLDSTVVAALALECGVTDLTLLTVSFVDRTTNPTSNDGDEAMTAKVSLAADAMAAEQSFCELRELYPHANIYLVHRIVDWQQVAQAEARIRQLMHPKTTVMDLNIATALWFAASASPDHCAHNGPMHLPPPPHRGVLLSGLGADEMLGGYGRHRSAYERDGYPGLRRELNVDIGRLWDRNLGRDDRILSDSSQEVRFPFLDAMVMHHVQSLPLDMVVDYSLPAGEGDKRILRLVAASLGLATATTAVKRAIQFGSRIAHVSDKRRFGSRRKAAGDKVS
jgi:asparagine synthetase B (glutamine-hydrolysing)